MKKYLLMGAVVVILAGIFIGFGGRHAEYEFSVLKGPEGIVLAGDSAGYVGRAEYEVKAWVTNQTGATLNYLPVFAVIKTADGNKIGLAMGNTGPAFKNGAKMRINLDTNIPKEMGKPADIVLYSELNK
jgi:hypothetical protein